MSATDEELKFVKSIKVDHVSYALIMFRYFHAPLIMMVHDLFAPTSVVLHSPSTSTLYF